MENSKLRSAGTLVNRFIDSLGIEDHSGLLPFFQAWGQIAGTDLAAHSRPVDIRNGSLIVQVDHPGWSQRLQMNRVRLQKKIRSRYPDLDIRNIHVYVSDELPATIPDISPETKPGKKPAISRPEPVAEPELNEIQDEELKRSLAGIAKALEQRAGSS